MTDIPKTSLGFTADMEADSSGFEKPSREQYNLNVGRVATAPLSAADGGDAHGDRSPRGRAPGAPSAKSVQPTD